MMTLMKKMDIHEKGARLPVTFVDSKDSTVPENNFNMIEYDAAIPLFSRRKWND